MALFRGKDMRVRISLSLPQGSFDQLPKSGRIAAYRLDEADVRDLDTTGILGFLTESNGRTVTSVVFHGEGPIPPTGALRDILNARRVTVRFFPDRGSAVDTNFEMHGAASTIASAINTR